MKFNISCEDNEDTGKRAVLLTYDNGSKYRYSGTVLNIDKTDISVLVKWINKFFEEISKNEQNETSSK